jgi:RecB family exonuclease
MQGVVDRVVRARDGAIEVHDYKTGQRVPGQRQLDADRQLAFYQMGLAPRFGHERPYRLVWHYLLHDAVRTSTRTPEQIDALRADTIELIDRIRDTTEFPAKPSALCGWCEYADRCPAGPGRSAGAPEAAPRGVPPGPAPSADPIGPAAPTDRAGESADAEPSAAPPRSGQLSLL